MRKESKFKISTMARQRLLADAEVQRLVGERIFPCIAPEGTDSDYVVYFRDGYNVDKTKQGIYTQTATVMFIAISPDYERSQDIAEAVFNALQGRFPEAEYNLEDSSEDYIDQKYFQFLLFRIT